jgi:hypothetical protein
MKTANKNMVSHSELGPGGNNLSEAYGEEASLWMAQFRDAE